MIKKVVIPCAGLGTRLLLATKEQPKEMLPIFARSEDGRLCLKPMLQLVFESIYHAGLREFCFITGRGKRSIEDYFTLDYAFVNYLKARNKFEIVDELTLFYEKVKRSSLIFANQSEPRGFGDAVYCAKAFTGSESFLVHAGDDLIVSRRNEYLTRLIQVFDKYRANAVFYLEKVKNPREYGVVVGEKVKSGLYRVRQVVEKPARPPSNLAIVAVYVFDPRIYQAIENTRPDSGNELQLTGAIQQLIDQGLDVYGVELGAAERRIDIGNVRSYRRALDLTAKGI